MGKAPIFTEAGFKKMIRGGELQMDVNSIEVTARPFSMVETPAELDGDRVSIESKVRMYTGSPPHSRSGLVKLTSSDDALIFIMYHPARVVSFFAVNLPNDL